LRKQIADYLRTRQPAMFDRLYDEPALNDPRIARLQAATPGLGSSAAIRVLLEANAEELTRLQNGGRVPLRLLEISREYARQRRSTMRLPVCTWKIRPAATANGWPCALERLPGWSDEVRLEVREGSVDGPLIDSIGSESAGQTQYLVKRGPVYQAYNAHGKRSTASRGAGTTFCLDPPCVARSDATGSGFAEVSRSADCAGQ
jgi:hypothetical protein